MSSTELAAIIGLAVIFVAAIAAIATLFDVRVRERNAA